ncbi:MAG: hypothetical protein U0236_20075 [Nitrospira sp.]
MTYTVAITLLCLGLAYVCGGIALYEWMKLQGYRKKVRVISAVICVAILLMASWFVRDWFEQGETFHIELPVIMKYDADSMLVTDLMFGHNDVMSPINFGFYVQVTNLQKVQSKIASYSFKVSTSSSGPWKSLMRIPHGNGDLYIVSSRNFNQAPAFRTLYSLDSTLNERPLAPGETREGWVFFERRDVLPSETQFVKIRLRDAAGSETIQTLNLDQRGSTFDANFQNGSLVSTGRRVDLISKYRFGYYYPSYPPE